MWREHANLHAAFSPNTNVHPAFGNVFKIERNRHLTHSVMWLNYGMESARTGNKPIETMNDPHHRKPELILARYREEISIAGRTRGRIEPRAPGQVKWRYPYWTMQRPPALPQRMGPFTQGSLEKQSIMYRISSAFRNMGT
jgi:hypothetical protein